MEDVLPTNPHVSAVFCANDQVALGALQTLAARHLTSKIKLVGFDGAIEATQAIIAKQMYATVAQDPFGMAQIGIEEAVRAVKHEGVKRTVNTGNPLVTQRNAEAYLAKVEKKLGGERAVARFMRRGRSARRRAPAPPCAGRSRSGGR